MSLITRITDVTFTDTSLPKLYRDSVINPGTQFLYDSKNPLSWPKQAAPAAGSPSADKWVDLVDLSNDGLFTDLAAGWATNGGFVSGGGPMDKIQANNGVVPSALTKMLAVVWFKHTSGGGTFNSLVANFADMLTICHTNALTSGIPANRYYAVSNGSAPGEILGIGDTSGLAGQIFQVALSWDNAERAIRFYVNGVYTGLRGGFQNLAAPTRMYSLMQASGYNSDYRGTFYRWFLDNLSGNKTAAELVAIDWAANNGRFA